MKAHLRFLAEDLVEFLKLEVVHLNVGLAPALGIHYLFADKKNAPHCRTHADLYRDCKVMKIH